MKIAEFEMEFFSAVYEFFHEYEFELIPTLKQFRRTTTRGFQNIIFSSTAYEGEFWVEVHLGTRLHAVEQVCQQFLFHLSDHQPHANTIIASVGRIVGQRYFKYKVHDLTSFEKAVSDLKSFMQTDGFPFMQKMYSVKSVSEALNESPTLPSNLVYNQVHRCFKGLASAHLSGNSQLISLSEAYLKGLSVIGAPDLMKVRFQMLANYLLHYYSVN